jgi:yeast amino acid transporter
LFSLTRSSDTGTAGQSPFVIAITRAGVRGLPHVINGAIFSSALSAGNSFLFCSSRVLYGLALRGQAPKILTYCTKQGLPIAAVLVCSAFSVLSFLNVSSGGVTVFHWFVSLSTTAGFSSWFAMNLTYIFFRRGLIAQGYDPAQNAYHNRFQPYIAYWGVGWTLFFILINGFNVFWKFNASGFLTAYISIPLFVGLYFFWKVYKRTKIWKPLEMDFVTGIPTVEETEIPEEPPRNVGEKIANWLF